MSPRMIVPPPPGLAPQDELLARAVAIGMSGQSPAMRRFHFISNLLYWAGICTIAVWFMAMAIDREPPVKFTHRDLANPDRIVHQGEQIMVRATRMRTRQCELVKRQSVVDGYGRRTDYEAEKFDAYGPITTTPETDVTGPYVPLDAAPGRGRLITTFAWDCNILQRALSWSIVLTPPPLEFEIVSRDRT